VPNRIKELDGMSVGARNGAPVESVRPAPLVSSSTGGPSAALSNSDSVQITPHARLMTSLSQAVQSAPEIDATRVSTLQQAIESGQYQVDPEQTATRLFRLEHDLGTAGSQ